MKLIIAGSRHLNIPVAMIDWVVDQFPLGEISEVVCGGAKGIDTSGAQAADYFDIPVTEFPADWDTHGNSAGPIRNRQMAEYGDALLLIWDGNSPGSKNMKFEMEKLGKPVFEYIIKKVYNE